MRLAWKLNQIFRARFSIYFVRKTTSEANLTYFTKLITSQLNLKGSHLCLERAKRRVDITSYTQNIEFNFILENNAAVKISKQSKPYIFRCSEFISTWNCSKCVLVCSSSLTVQEHLNFLTLDYFFIPSSVPRTTSRCTTWNPSTTHCRELATVGTTETHMSRPSPKVPLVRSP